MASLAPEGHDPAQAACTSGPKLRLAVLFGSQACGRASAGSDVDIGIIPCDADLSLHDELALASALSGVVGAEVDLIRLDGEDPLLGREVAVSGACLFEATPGTFAAYRADAMSRWIEHEESYAPHRERFLRRIASGQP